MSKLLPASVVLALGTALAGCGTAAPAASEGTWQSSPPEGTRWVGLGQVVVAVPEWWTTGETQCLAPVEDTVYFDSGAQADCEDPPDPGTVKEVSALAVLDGRHGYGELLTRDMHPIGEVAGEKVVEHEGCEDWFPGVCRRVFAVPSHGVVFAVTIAEEGDGSYEEIRDSVQVLPDELTTVPLATAAGWTPTWGAEPRTVDDLRAVLDDADLHVEIVTADPPEEETTMLTASLPAGSLLDVSPQLGSIIDVGGTVTLTVAPEPAIRSERGGTSRSAGP